MEDVNKDEVFEKVEEKRWSCWNRRSCWRKIRWENRTLNWRNEATTWRVESKNAEPSPEDVAREEKMKELWNKEVNLELRMAGLEDFAEFINVEEHNSKQLQEKIQKFQEVLGKRELSSGYVPQNHRQTDKYSLAEKNKDTKSMIGLKLSKFFK